MCVKEDPRECGDNCAANVASRASVRTGPLRHLRPQDANLEKRAVGRSLSSNTTGGARPWLGRHSAACAPTPKDLFYGSRCLTPSKKEQQKEQEQDAAPPYRATLYTATYGFHLRSREFRDVGSFHNVLCLEIGTWRRYVFHDYKFAVQGMRGASGIR